MSARDPAITFPQIKREKLRMVAFTLLFLFAFGYSHQAYFDSPTPVSRLDLLHALIKGKLNIDEYQSNTPDKALFEGHYYSDKAPGAVVAALPAFLIATLILEASGTSIDSPHGWFTSSWISCVGSNGIISAFGATFMFAWLSRRVSPRAAFITSLALFLGAAPLPYSTMMFSHALVVGLGAISLWAIEKGTESNCSDSASQRTNPGLRSERHRDHKELVWAHRWDILAGIACGWILASEYTAAIIVAGIFLWLFLIDRRRIIGFSIGIIPPVLLIPLYSWSTIGNPLELPYSYQATFPAMQEGLYAIKLPNVDTACNLLFSPSRGLFFWTPFIIMAIVGYWKSAIIKDKALFWITYVSPVILVVVISGRTWDWQAGPTLGPRYLAPMLPLLALPCALGVDRLPILGALLAIYSIAITTLATITNACLESNVYNPLVEINLSLFIQGKFCPNIGTAIGLPAFVSVITYYLIIFVSAFALWFRMGSGECRRRISANP
jgi:hypothetical protein